MFRVFIHVFLMIFRTQAHFSCAIEELKSGSAQYSLFENIVLFFHLSAQQRRVYTTADCNVIAFFSI